ncbi:MAG TPA: zinc-ribbon domain-containing protein [Oscillospiraceae bacterium]|nr:zinc-ribbon domain-containing protein [Oscillospiraceae bacterium]HPS34171.1 zinc-ribbon domain-containing protein [Oscillospiraceae bacterium]
MPFCGKCGAEVPEGTKFCGVCGAEIGGAQQAAPVGTPVGAPVQTDDAKDAADNKAMGILAYFGPLVFVPMFAAKTSKFARFHTVQGFNLFLAEIAFSIVEWILIAIFWAISWKLGSIMSTVLGLLWLAFTVLAIIGIVNAAKGEKKALPVIGKLHILDSFMKPSV